MSKYFQICLISFLVLFNAFGVYSEEACGDIVEYLDYESDFGSSFSTDCTYAVDYRDFSNIPGCTVYNFSSELPTDRGRGYWAPCGLNRTFCTISWRKTDDWYWDGPDDDVGLGSRIWTVGSYLTFSEYSDETLYPDQDQGGGETWLEWTPPLCKNCSDPEYYLNAAKFQLNKGGDSVDGPVSIIDNIKIIKYQKNICKI